MGDPLEQVFSVVLRYPMIFAEAVEARLNKFSPHSDLTPKVRRELLYAFTPPPDHFLRPYPEGIVNPLQGPLGIHYQIAGLREEAWKEVFLATRDEKGNFLLGSPNGKKVGLYFEEVSRVAKGSLGTLKSYKTALEIAERNLGKETISNLIIQVIEEKVPLQDLPQAIHPLMRADRLAVAVNKNFCHEVSALHGAVQVARKAPSTKQLGKFLTCLGGLSLLISIRALANKLSDGINSASTINNFFTELMFSQLPLPIWGVLEGVKLLIG